MVASLSRPACECSLASFCDCCSVELTEAHYASFVLASKQNLGIYLLKFLEFYGHRLNFVTTGLRLKGQGTFFNKQAVRHLLLLQLLLLLLLLPLCNILELSLEVETFHNSHQRARTCSDIAGGKVQNEPPVPAQRRESM